MNYYDDTAADRWAWQVMAAVNRGEAPDIPLAELISRMIVKDGVAGWGLGDHYSIEGVRVDPEAFYTYQTCWATRALSKAKYTLQYPVWMPLPLDGSMFCYTDSPDVTRYVPNIQAMLGITPRGYRDGNWHYDDGRPEDAMHLGMMVEWMDTPPMECFDRLIQIAFYPRPKPWQLVRQYRRLRYPVDQGSCGWAPALIYSALRKHNAYPDAQMWLRAYMRNNRPKNLRARAAFEWALSL